MKKFFRISALTAGLLIVGFISLLIAVQTPRVQTLLAKKAVAVLEDDFGGTIDFSRVELHPFDALVLKDIVILDKEPYRMEGFTPVDTIIRAKHLVATFSLRGLLKKEGIHIQRAYLHDAVFNFVSEPQTTNIQRFLNSQPKDEKKEMGDIFDASQVEIRNLRFTMTNYSGIQKELERAASLGIPAENPAGTIDWDLFDAHITSLKGKNIKLSDGYMSGTLLSAELSEKSGLHIRDISGKAKVGHGKTVVDEIYLTDDYSQLYLPNFTLTYADQDAFKDFIAQVKMDGEMRDSRLDIKSIGFFASALQQMNIIADIANARVSGYVNDLNVRRLRFTEENSGFYGNLRGRITGLPDSQGMLTDLQNCELGFTTTGLGKFIKGWSPTTDLDLSAYAPNEQFTFKGTGNGPLNRMKIDGTLSSNLGTVYTDLDIRNLIDPQRAIRIGSYLSVNNLNVGKIAGTDAVKECSLKTSLSATFTPGAPSFKVDSLIVSKANILDYEYTNIAAAGVYEDNAFDGRVVCNDPNLNFLFQGIVNLTRTAPNAVYKFFANLGYADLNALNIDKRGTSKLSGMVNANYIRANKGDLTGSINVMDLRFEDYLGKHNIGNIDITSHQNDDMYRINFGSKFADGNYIGSKSIMDLIRDIQDATIKKELPALYGAKVEDRMYDDYDISFNFHDTRDILSLLNPNLYIADSTTVKVNMTRNGNVRGSVKSQRIALGNKYLKDLNLQFDNRDGSINGTMQSGEMSISSIQFKNNAFVLYADNDRLGVGYSFDNETETDNKGELFLTGLLERSEKDSLILKAQTLPSNFYYNGNGWSIKPATITIAGSDISIGNLTAANEDQFISVNGGISPSRTDTLEVNMSKFDIALLNSVIGENYGISGLATGRALLTSPTKSSLGLLANIRCDSTYFAQQRMGTLQLASSWDDDKLHILMNNNLDGQKTLDVHADYFPSSGTLDANADLNALNVAYAYPFLKDIFSQMDGYVNAKVHAWGPMKNLELESEGGQFNNVSFTVDFTKVKYLASGPIHLNSNGLFFDDVAIRDTKRGTGTLSGGVTFDHLRDLGTDIHAHFDRIECLDLTEKDSEYFYGNIFATGDISITGPMSAILLEADAETTRNGSFSIPMSGSASSSTSDLLVFKEEEHYVEIDPYDLMMNRINEKEKSASDFAVKLKIEATPNVTANIEIDKETGNVLTGSGNGTITVDVHPSRGIFSLGGDYNITSGSYHFNAMNLAKRDFTIQDGSSVRFNGDVMDTDLDINALYTTKTSLSTLLRDSTSVTSRRTVECGIAITDKLRNPQVSFSIDVPDLDPTTKSMVESALNTEDKIQKQFLYLLIANSFLPEEQSGIANNSNMLYSNVAQMMANQLNNIMQKLDIPLDLGLTYQEDDRGQNIFDVAVSTQLFNNRVVVNGTVGSRQYTTSGSSGDVVGDLDIEVKVGNTGQFRVNLFSHSADDYTNFLDNTQRNGAGLTYQKEFNSLKELIRNLFTSKKKRQRLLEEHMQEVGEHHHHDDESLEQVTINIEHPQENAE